MQNILLKKNWMETIHFLCSIASIAMTIPAENIGEENNIRNKKEYQNKLEIHYNKPWFPSPQLETSTVLLMKVTYYEALLPTPSVATS